MRFDEYVSVNQLGVPVSYELNAVATGEVTLRLSVNYDVVNCAGTGREGCVFFFDTEQGPKIVVYVAPLFGAINCDGVVTSADASMIFTLVSARVVV